MASSRSKKEKRRSGSRDVSLSNIGPLISKLIKPYLERARTDIEREASESGVSPDPVQWKHDTNNITLLATGAISLAQFPEADERRIAKEMIDGLPSDLRKLALKTLLEMTLQARTILNKS